MGQSTAVKLVACLVMFAVLCVPAVFVNTAIGYLPVLFFVALLGLCFAYAHACARGLSSDAMTGAQACVRGSTVGVLLRIRSAVPLFVPRVDVTFRISDLFGQDALAETSSVAIRPRSTEDFEFDLGFSHIGEFQVGLRDLAVHDPLGLFCIKVPGRCDCSVVVTPRLRELGAVVLSETSAKQATDALKPSYSSGEDYSGVREYVPGDPMKLIHWKLSARTEGYFTKTFETHADPSLDIFVNFSAPSYDSETLMSLYDAAVETALSLEAHAYESGMSTRLVFLNAEGEVDQFNLGHGADFRDLMARLPRIEPGGADRFSDMLATRATGIHAADNIAVCSPFVDAALGKALARVRSTRRSVLMFALLPSEMERQEHRELVSQLRSLGEAGVLCSVVDADGGGRL